MQNQCNSSQSEQLYKCVLKLFQDNKLAVYVSNLIKQIVHYQPKLLRSTKTTLHFEISFQSSSSLYYFSNKFQTQSEEIKFLIQISKQFPLKHPNIFLKSHLTNPNIADCRDLFNQIAQGGEWTFDCHLNFFVKKIPNFLERLSKTNNSIQLQKLGCFYPNKIYNYLLISQLNSGQKYYAFQTDGQQVKLLLVYLTQTHIIQFLPKQQPIFIQDKLKIPKLSQITQVQLIFIADLQSVHIIEVDKQKNDFIIKFMSVKTNYMEFNRKTVQKHFKIANSVNFLQRLLKFIINLQAIQINLQITKPNLEQEEALILRDVYKYEQKIQHYLNKQTIEELNDVYQQIVQFYSSNNNPYYLIYLHKISNLYERKDVKLILEVQQS